MGTKSQIAFAAAVVAAGIGVSAAWASPAVMSVASRPASPAATNTTGTPPVDRVAATSSRTSPSFVTSPWTYVSQAVKSNPVVTAFKSDKPKVTSATHPAPHADSTTQSAPTAPSSPEMVIATAQMYEQRGDTFHARLVYQRSLRTWPGDAEILRAAARMEDRAGELPVAENLYQQVVAANPKNAGALNDLGLCLARQGKLDASLSAVEQAVRLEPSNARYRNNAATVCVEVRQDQRAMAHLSAVHPPAIVQYNMGELLVARGRSGEAERYYRAALEIDPGLQEASYAIAQISAGRQSVPPGTEQPQSVATGAMESAPTPMAVGTADQAAASQAGAQGPPQYASPQAGPQLGPQMSYPSEARGNDGYGRSTYAPPVQQQPLGSSSYQPQTGLPSTTSGVATGGYFQGGYPAVGQATPHYLPPVGAVPNGVRR